MSSPDNSPKFNLVDDEAEIFISKRLLVGLTHCKQDNSVISREQFHGTIIRINSQEGIVIRLNASNEERCIPADISQLRLTPPGQYRLTGTNEVVIDPDYTLRLNLYSGK